MRYVGYLTAKQGIFLMTLCLLYPFSQNPAFDADLSTQAFCEIFKILRYREIFEEKSTINREVEVYEKNYSLHEKCRTKDLHQNGSGAPQQPRGRIFGHGCSDTHIYRYRKFASCWALCFVRGYHSANANSKN